MCYAASPQMYRASRAPSTVALIYLAHGRARIDIAQPAYVHTRTHTLRWFCDYDYDDDDLVYGEASATIGAYKCADLAVSSK